MPEKGDPEDLPQVVYDAVAASHRPHKLLDSHAALLSFHHICFMCVLQAPWGIISVKAQDEDFETPMQPITIMRNSLVSILPPATS